MSQRIAFKHSDAVWYTMGTLEEVAAALNAGQPIEVFGFATNGDHWTERMIFYGFPDWIGTDGAMEA